MGASFIPLIPKTSGANVISDFGPIGLICSAYKILAKVLVDRLLKILPSVVSPSQDAFVHGRQILDDVLNANECVHSRFKEVSQVCLVSWLWKEPVIGLIGVFFFMCFK